jgi:hypothetical protein
VAISVGITERAVQKIVRDLQDDGYLEVSKHGRRNRYRINNRKAMRHPLQTGCTVGQLLGLLSRPETDKTDKADKSEIVKSAKQPKQAQPAEKAVMSPEPRTKNAPKGVEPDDGAAAKDSANSAAKDATNELGQGRLF